LRNSNQKRGLRYRRGPSATLFRHSGAGTAAPQAEMGCIAVRADTHTHAAPDGRNRPKSFRFPAHRLGCGLSRITPRIPEALAHARSRLRKRMADAQEAHRHPPERVGMESRFGPRIRQPLSAPPVVRVPSARNPGPGAGDGGKEQGAGAAGVIVLWGFVNACAMPRFPDFLTTPDPFSLSR
jgi:hypothetical protein